MSKIDSDKNMSVSHCNFQIRSHCACMGQSSQGAWTVRLGGLSKIPRGHNMNRKHILNPHKSHSENSVDPVEL